MDDTKSAGDAGFVDDINQAYTNINDLDDRVTANAAALAAKADASAVALKADLDSPALTGNPTAPTPTPGDNDTTIATTAFVETRALAAVADAINDGTTTIAPSQNAVFDALALVIPKSIIDAKGDLIVGTANDTSAKLTAGSNGAMLLADSAQSTGLKWSTSLTLEGSGSPEGVVTASVGSEYRDTTNGVLYVKVTGAGNTGWSSLTSGTVTAWTNVSGGIGFLNSWVDYGGAFNVMQYRKIGDVVYLRGLIKNGTSGQKAFTLPVGHRPPADLIGLGITNTGFGFINVEADGDVIPTISTGTNALFSINFNFSVTT